MASSKTITAYRIVSPRWVDSAFSGEGARLYGGRWNSPGKPVVYLGSSRSLCALELLVHLTTPGSREKEFALLQATLPEEAIKNATALLPPDWRQEPPQQSSMQIGDDWLSEAKSLALRVPSAIIPEESNYLLNPLHPDFLQLKLSEPAAFHFDLRL